MDALYEAVITDKKTNAQLLKENSKWARNEKVINFLRFTGSEEASDRQETGVKVYVLWGPTGTGKTFSAKNFIAGNKSYYICHCPSTKGSKLWFHGYQSQQVLIMDDFDSSFCEYRWFLGLLDKYPFQLESKGGMAWATFHTIVITSNVRPDAWFQTALGLTDMTPLQRRITEIRHCTEKELFQREDWEGKLIGDYERWTQQPAAAAATAEPPEEHIEEPLPNSQRLPTPPSPDMLQDAQDYEADLLVPETPPQCPPTRPWPKNPFIDDEAADDDDTVESIDSDSDDDCVIIDP